MSGLGAMGGMGGMGGAIAKREGPAAAQPCGIIRP
jgi:hypothetical protein